METQKGDVFREMETEAAPKKESKYPILMDQLTKNIFTLRDRLEVVLQPSIQVDGVKDEVKNPNKPTGDAELIERLGEFNRITQSILNRLAL